MEGRDRGFQRTVKSAARVKGLPTKNDRRTEGRRAITGKTDLCHLVGSDSHVRFDPIDPEGLLAIESQNTIEIHHVSGVGQIGCLDRSTWGGLPVLSPQSDHPRSTRSAPGEDEECQKTEEGPQKCLRLDLRHGIPSARGVRRPTAYPEGQKTTSIRRDTCSDVSKGSFSGGGEWRNWQTRGT